VKIKESKSGVRRRERERDRPLSTKKEKERKKKEATVGRESKLSKAGHP
jgi:hypothetical protein